jgi:hypothetical protein
MIELHFIGLGDNEEHHGFPFNFMTEQVVVVVSF